MTCHRRRRHPIHRLHHHQSRRWNRCLNRTNAIRCCFPSCQNFRSCRCCCPNRRCFQSLHCPRSCRYRLSCHRHHHLHHPRRHRRQKPDAALLQPERPRSRPGETGDCVFSLSKHQSGGFKRYSADSWTAFQEKPGPIGRKRKRNPALPAAADGVPMPKIFRVWGRKVFGKTC